MIEMPARSGASAVEEHFYAHGWAVAALPDPAPVHAVRAAILAELRRLTGEPDVTLEQYQQVAGDDDTHTELQLQLTAFFRSQGFNRLVLGAQRDLLTPFLGPDLDVQRNPFLRMTRPGQAQDNIGFHRDTFYGGSPYEVSVIIPYVDVPAESSVAVLSGSHVRPESDFPVTQIQNPDPAVFKGSPKHRLGFPYAPKVMDPATIADVQAVPLALGEALLVGLATVHGSEVNRGDTCRWTTDIRVVHALAPVDLSMRPDFYEPLCRSVVTDRAVAYFAAQGEAAGT